MSDAQQQQWIALVMTVWIASVSGQELIASDYQRIPVPTPLDNGMIPSLSISPLPGWPIIVGWEVWDAQTGGTYLYGADLLWPVGQGGGFTLLFDADGVASQFNPDAEVAALPPVPLPPVESGDGLL